ncbi:MAG: hypothetical protein QOE08_1598 [Thermoleophilaceae bacterium]|jgi:hypothetical protein|nr:hypothetical protein [Thermoleophilaceae bacterium]
MSAIATIVDWGKLGEVVLASALAGVGVTLAFSLAILGTSRFSDLRREQRYPAAAAFALIATVGYAACLAAVAFGGIVMTTK